VGLNPGNLAWAASAKAADIIKAQNYVAGTITQQFNFQMSAFGGPGGRQINSKPAP
jgi:hypothetical protein